ncbi:MAG TPA: HepT-like ribonuclease domain-containing protein [Tepidisphaeraceae bacterium]|jgi:uncharacterized protein with HEPN domain
MKRDELAYVIDIFERAERLHDRMPTITREQFDADFIIFDGVAHTLQVIGEAASKLGKDYRASIPQVPWPKVIAMRHIIVHGYHRTNPDTIWKTANNQMRPLVDALRPLVEAARRAIAAGDPINGDSKS